jgi:hypothetical protein
VPFIFYIVTLYAGQSVIFIPHLTPTTFEWTLFNVRYGVTAIPFIAVCVGYLFWRCRSLGKTVIITLMIVQAMLYMVGYSDILTYKDGTMGLSHQKKVDGEIWLSMNYDGGVVLIDDYMRRMSIVRTPIPMNKILYMGNKPFYHDALSQPEKYVRWIVMQKDDALWLHFYSSDINRARLYTYYQKAYTSKELLIFKLIEPRTLKM